jgi:hypothetical protein
MTSEQKQAVRYAYIDINASIKLIHNQGVIDNDSREILTAQQGTITELLRVFPWLFEEIEDHENEEVTL